MNGTRKRIGLAGMWIAAGMLHGLAEAAHNTLTAQEQAAGYQLLFNGKNLAGFHTYHSSLPPPNWEAVPESAHTVVKVVNTTGGTQHLITKDSSFQDFDLKVEWMVPNAGNSGIFIRYMEINEWGGASGPEAQVVDINHPDGKTELHRAGTDYDMFPLLPGRDNWWNPTGKWNQFRIIAHGPHVAHYGNGHKVEEYTMFSAAWTAAYNASKYKAYPKYADVHPGSIYFQHHGELGIAYRDIRIKKLTAAQNPWAAGSPYLKPDGSGLIDDLTFEDNLYVVSTRIGLPEPSRTGFRILGGGAPSLIFPERGDYTVSLLGLDGRMLSTLDLHGADRYPLPLRDRSGTARILQVTAGGVPMLRSLIAGH